jgi:hypothetical protein
VIFASCMSKNYFGSAKPWAIFKADDDNNVVKFYNHLCVWYLYGFGSNSAKQYKQYLVGCELVYDTKMDGYFLTSFTHLLSMIVDGFAS